jgi:enoyl-CoA hydratase/carnithine racemase
MADGLRAAAADDSIRAVIIAGGSDFTAGNDLADFARAGDGGPRPGAAFEFLQVIRSFPKPLVAGVRGVAIGIGTTMLLHCDVVVTARDAKLQMPFVRLGLVPDTGLTLTLPRLVGEARARALLMTGADVSAEEAAAMGMIHQCVDDDTFVAETRILAERLARLPPGTHRLTRQAIVAGRLNTLHAQMEHEARLQAGRVLSDEFRAAMAAFAARRKS